MAKENVRLKVFRALRGLTQANMAEFGGVSLTTYHLIECGKRKGSFIFWENIKNHFDLTWEEVCSIQKNEQI